MAKGETQPDKAWAFLAVFLGIIGFVLALIVKREDKYVMYYAQQSLVIVIGSIVAGIVWGATALILIGFIIGPILYLILFILWIFGWVYALSGEKKPVPLIGEYGEKFNF